MDALQKTRSVQWHLVPGFRALQYHQQPCHWLSVKTPHLIVQCIPRNVHTVTALLCFVVVIHWLIFPYPSGLLHWHCGNLTIAPAPAKQPWWIWINTSCEFVMNDCITTTKQSTTKPCAYFLGYTVLHEEGCQHPVPSRCRVIRDNICIYLIMLRYHVGVIKWKHFPRYLPFLRGIHRSPVNSPHKEQWRGTLWFSLSAP